MLPQGLACSERSSHLEATHGTASSSLKTHRLSQRLHPTTSSPDEEPTPGLNLSPVPRRPEGREGDSLGVSQAEGFDVVRSQGPAHPDLLVPVSGEDVAVVRAHGLCARVRKGRSTHGTASAALPLLSLDAPRLQPLHSCPHRPSQHNSLLLPLPSCLQRPRHLPLLPISRVPMSSRSPSSDFPLVMSACPSGDSPQLHHPWLALTGPPGACGGTAPSSGVGRTPR